MTGGGDEQTGWWLFAVAALYTKDSMISGETFGAGGPDSVRGYLILEASDDKGYTTQLEVYTPNTASLLGLGDSWKSRIVGFYDFGQVSRNNPLAGDRTANSLPVRGSVCG